MPDSILQLIVFGEDGSRKHFLILGSSTPVLNRTTSLPCKPPIKTLKRRHYDQRVREIEHSTFTPLFLSTTGGMGKVATTFYKRLTSFLSDKRDENYSHTMGWLRCRWSFALLRSSIMCIRLYTNVT